MEALLTMLLSDRFGGLAKDEGAKPQRSAEAETLRKEIYDTLKKQPQPQAMDDESKKPAGKK